VMAHGNKVLRCAPEQLREMSPEQEAALKFIPVEALAKQGKYAMIGAQTFTDLSEKGNPREEGYNGSSGESPPKRHRIGGNQDPSSDAKRLRMMFQKEMEKTACQKKVR